MTPITRRKLLAASAAGTGAVLAGCLGDDDPENDEEEPTDQPEDEGNGDDGFEEPEDSADDDTDTTDEEDAGSTPALYYIDIENGTDESRTAHVIVEDDGELIHWSDLSLDAGETRRVERNWDTVPGSYVVSVRLDGQDEWRQVDLTRENSPCYGLFTRVREGDELNVLLDPAPSGCEEDTDN